MFTLVFILFSALMLGSLVVAIFDDGQGKLFNIGFTIFYIGLTGVCGMLSYALSYDYNKHDLLVATQLGTAIENKLYIIQDATGLEKANFATITTKFPHSNLQDRIQVATWYARNDVKLTPTMVTLDKLGVVHVTVKHPFCSFN